MNANTASHVVVVVVDDDGGDCECVSTLFPAE
jgi:hypothetical protein